MHRIEGEAARIGVVVEDLLTLARVSRCSSASGGPRAAASAAGAEPGLGLAIVAAIVAAHDGRVRAENAPAGGALFTVALPAADRAAATQRLLA